MRLRFILCAVLLIAAATACSDDPVIPPPPKYQPLTTRLAVLSNLEEAYNQRNVTEFEKLLDDGFTFFLSDGDVNSGLPEQWDRSVEVQANQNLFSKSKVGDLPLVKSIQMDVQFENGIQWTPGTTDGWFTAALFYTFQITVEQEAQSEDLTYYPGPGSQAQFTVRNAGTDENPKWQLVEWRDLSGSLVGAHSAGVPEHTSWGSLKALYSGYQSVTTRTAVLNNLEEAYNQRNVSEFEKLLDDNFTFFLSDGDVNNGLPEQWGRSVEVQATGNLFSGSKVGDLPLVKSIDVDVQFEEGVQWIAVDVSGETWYATTAFYIFQITVEQEGQSEDLTYYPPSGSKAQFMVRNTGTDSVPKWQLVEWRDLGAGNLAAALSGAATEQTTWGAVKSLFR